MKIERTNEQQKKLFEEESLAFPTDLFAMKVSLMGSDRKLMRASPSLSLSLSRLENKNTAVLAARQSLKRRTCLRNKDLLICSCSSSSSRGEVEQNCGGRGEAKEEVLSAIRGTFRGENTTMMGRKDILAKIERLEGQNETPTTQIREQLEGGWVLLYQAPTKEEEDMSEYEKKAVTVEGPFLSTFKPLTRDLIRTLSNTQIIRVGEERIENIAEFKVANRWKGKLVIDGSVVLGPMQEAEETERRKAFVTFSSFTLSLEDRKLFTIPVDKILTGLGKELPKGWLLTSKSYLKRFFSLPSLFFFPFATTFVSKADADFINFSKKLTWMRTLGWAEGTKAQSLWRRE